jgi:hypothetical protein
MWARVHLCNPQSIVDLHFLFLFTSPFYSVNPLSFSFGTRVMSDAVRRNLEKLNGDLRPFIEHKYFEEVFLTTAT